MFSLKLSGGATTYDLLCTKIEGDCELFALFLLCKQVGKLFKMCREGMTGAENVDAFDKVLHEFVGLLFLSHATSAAVTSPNTPRRCVAVFC